MSQASAGNFLRNQTIAAVFLVIEVLAAAHIGFGNLLAWLLAGIAAWNASLILIGVVGVAMIAAKAVNDEEANR